MCHVHVLDDRNRSSLVQRHSGDDVVLSQHWFYEAYKIYEGGSKVYLFWRLHTQRMQQYELIHSQLS